MFIRYLQGYCWHVSLDFWPWLQQALVYLSTGGYNKNDPKCHNLLLCLLMTASDLSDQTKSWNNTKHIAVTFIFHVSYPQTSFFTDVITVRIYYHSSVYPVESNVRAPERGVNRENFSFLNDMKWYHTTNKLQENIFICSKLCVSCRTKVIEWHEQGNANMNMFVFAGTYLSRVFLPGRPWKGIGWKPYWNDGQGKSLCPWPANIFLGQHSHSGL